ncbi:DUF4232 domain-containing protein [Streptomyces sp. NPDC093586]|uniref:DUF4232 domain-containing protein n=1 Tax=Streptomyces sp. NPDC093586 TaxID=3366042 RepID=UPI0037F68BC2
MKHRLLLPGALLCCTVLAGCTGQNADGTAGAGAGPTAPGSSSPAETATGPAGADTPSPPGEPAPGTSPGAGTPSSGSAAPAVGRRCHTSELRASVGTGHPGAGQSNFAVVVTNGSRRTCTVHGFPGVAFVNGEGEAVTPDPERATDQEQRTVTLAPGASAWSAMTYTDPAITGVTTVTPTALRLTPPDETAWIPVRWTGGEVSNTGKASVPRVSPFRPGDGT